jgi:predicted N-acetyltransferase YhbS
MNITIRNESPEDYRATEILVREAFWDVYKPGCDEHFLLHNLRKSPAFVKELDLLACDNDKIIGSIAYSKAKIINDQKAEFTVLCMGPLAVLPEYQKKGIGSLLINISLEKAKSLDYNGVIIFGNPAYYRRFGFKNAKEFNIQTSEGKNLEPFMALELSENSLNSIEGKFFEDTVFKINEEELELFEKDFPFKEKHETDTQIK